jgi:alpha-N-arabinofuranosidase
MGIGNESWSCGGDMTPDYYVSQLKIYSRFVDNVNPCQQKGANQMLKIAVGPGFPETEWTEAVMKAWKQPRLELELRRPLGALVYDAERMAGLDAFKASALTITPRRSSPRCSWMSSCASRRPSWTSTTREKKVALVVDEWGAWHAPLPGTNKDFLVQQNSLRDAILASLNLNIFARHADRVRMANIAQMINVLQAMILTDKEKMVLTPTYYVFKMYVPFQDATFVPVDFDPGTLHRRDGITLPRVDALAARDASGKLWLEDHESRS